MSWVRIDDRAWCHPKLVALSAPAVRLWVWALCWSAQHETDGLIKLAALSILGGTKRVAAELVSAGLWDIRDDGWMVHDFLDWNPSAEERREKREQSVARLKRHRERIAKRVSNGAHNALVTPSETLLPIRIPDPNPRSHLKHKTSGSEDLSGSYAREAGPDADVFFENSGGEGYGECPKDLAKRPDAPRRIEALGVRFSVSESELWTALSAFVSYWTSGEGKGATRPDWWRTFEARVTTLHEQGRLTPPGAAEHQARNEQSQPRIIEHRRPDPKPLSRSELARLAEEAAAKVKAQ